MKIVVDTNIVFSAILNINGKIGELLFNPFFDFYTCDFLKQELNEHHEKLKKISKLSEDQLKISKTLIFSKLKFVNSILLEESILLSTEEIMMDIDPDDIEFIALGRQLNAKVWTGDKKMHNKLLEKGFDFTLLTDELWAFIVK